MFKCTPSTFLFLTLHVINLQEICERFLRIGGAYVNSKPAGTLMQFLISSVMPTKPQSISWRRPFNTYPGQPYPCNYVCNLTEKPRIRLLIFPLLSSILSSLFFRKMNNYFTFYDNYALNINILSNCFTMRCTVHLVHISLVSVSFVDHWES